MLVYQRVIEQSYGSQLFPFVDDPNDGNIGGFS